MQLYLASADVDEVRWAAQHRLVDGVLTTPAMLTADPIATERDTVLAITRAIQGPVYVAVHAVTGGDIYRDARDLARLSDQVVVQIPLLEDSIAAMHRLSAEGVRVAATLVYSAAQALLASRVGVVGVVSPVDDLDACGQDGVGAVRALRAVFDASGSEADVIALRPADATEFAACALAGADAVAVTADVLRSLLVHPLTDRGVDRLLHDLSRQHGSWSLA